MKVVKEAKTTKETYSKAAKFSSACCGSDCMQKCKKCPPMKD